MTASNSPLYKDFETLVRAILESNHFTVRQSKVKDKYDFDIQLDDDYGIAEVKLYKSKFPKLDLLEIACQQLSSQKEDTESKLLLVVSSYITPSLKEEIFREYGIIVWDGQTLFSLAFDHAHLYYELEKILSNAFNSAVDDLSMIDRTEKDNIIPNFRLAKSTIAAKKPVVRGKILCDELNKLKPGRDDAQKFEDKCIEILKYLYDNKTDLTLWKPQPTTDDELHRFDLLTRIISSNQNTFWNELAHDFHTRYVVFEFKNYSDKIKQAQIYTTEKYLFLTALRSVSFIIARNDADANAKKAAKGALKEAGKLIVILTSDDICEMLTMKDKGDEPAVVLRRLIDDMLVHLAR